MTTPVSRAIAVLLPISLAGIGATLGALVGFFLTVNYATTGMQELMKQNNGDDGGASEVGFALVTGLPFGALIGLLLGSVLGFFISKRFFAQKY